MALACSSKGWRSAVNQEMIWRVLRKREGVRDKPNYLRKEYRDYAEKYDGSTLGPLCEEAFILVYPRFMERSWEEYVRMRCDNIGSEGEVIEIKESWMKSFLRGTGLYANKLSYLKINLIILFLSLVALIMLQSISDIELIT